MVFFQIFNMQKKKKVFIKSTLWAKLLKKVQQ